MKISRRLVCIVLSLSVCALSVRAQALDVPMDLTQLLQTATAAHPDIIAARLAIDAANQSVRSARLQYMPSPSVGLTGLEGQRATIYGLSQPLWTGGKLDAALDQASLKGQQAQANLDDVRQTLALRTVSLYQSYLTYKGRLVAQRKHVGRLQDLAAMIDRRVEAGISAKVDRELARSRLVQARSDLVATESGLAVVLSQMGQLTGLTLTEVDVVANFAIPDMAQRLNVDEVLAKSKAFNPRLKKSELDVGIARKDIDLTRAALWPAVAVRVEHQIGAYPGSLAEGNRVYLTVNYIPGAGVSALADTEAARQRASAAETQVDSQQRDLVDKVQADYVDLRSALARMSDLAEARQSADAVMTSSVRLFVTGRRSWQDLQNSARDLVANEQVESDSRAAAIGAFYRLQVQTGEFPEILQGGGQ